MKSKLFIESRKKSVPFSLEGASLGLVGHPFSDDIAIKITYGVDVLLHRSVSHPNFSYWVG